MFIYQKCGCGCEHFKLEVRACDPKNGRNSHLDLLIFLHFLVALSSSGITLKGRRKRQALHRGVMQKHIMTLAFHPCVFALKTWQMETRTLGDFTAEIKGRFLYTKLSFYFSRHFFVCIS